MSSSTCNLRVETSIYYILDYFYWRILNFKDVFLVANGTFFLIIFQEHRLSSPVGSRTPAKNPDRFYEEFDYDRRLKKRKTKLLAATEEAFAHLARVCEERIKGISALCYQEM